MNHSRLSTPIHVPPPPLNKEESIKGSSSTNKTPRSNDQERRKSEFLERSGSGTEGSDSVQQKNIRLASRLETGSNSSYKSSSITGPVETQESMTFAVNELGNGVSAGNFNAEDLVEEEYTAQFEPLECRIEQNEQGKRQKLQEITRQNQEKITNLPKAGPLNMGWRSTIQTIQTRNNQPKILSLDKSSRASSVSNKYSELDKSPPPLKTNALIQNSNLFKPLLEAQASIVPKSPFGIKGANQNNKTPNLIQPSGKNEEQQLMKEKVPISNKSSSIPSFKSFLQLHKAPEVGMTTAPSASHKVHDMEKSRQHSNNLFREAKAIIEEKPIPNLNTNIPDNLRQSVPISSKDSPSRHVNEKLKEIRGLMTTGKRTSPQQGFSSSLIQGVIKHPPTPIPEPDPKKPQTFEQMKAYLNAQRDKVQPGFKNNLKAQINRNDRLISELPVISEAPEINLNGQKQTILGNESQEEDDEDEDKEEEDESETESDDQEDDSEEKEERETQEKIEDRMIHYEKENNQKINQNVSQEDDGYENQERDEEDYVEESETDDAEEEETEERSQSKQRGSPLKQKKNFENIVEQKDMRTNEQGQEEREEEEEGEEEEYTEYESDEEDESENSTKENLKSADSDTKLEQNREIQNGILIERPLQDNINGEGRKDTDEEVDDEEDEETYYEESQEKSLQGTTKENEKHIDTKNSNVSFKQKFQQLNQSIFGKNGYDELKKVNIPRKPSPKATTSFSRDKYDIREEKSVRDPFYKYIKETEDDNSDLFKSHNTNGIEYIRKKYNEIETKLWNLKGRQWMFDKEVRLMQVSIRSLNERLDYLFDLAEDKCHQKDFVLSLTSSELNQIFSENS